MPPAPRPLVDRFWEMVRRGPSEECWPWTGSTRAGGYGAIAVRVPGRRHRLAPAHRVSWELHNGPIPDGLQVLHRCDNPPCVNPAHLFLGTNDDNVADMLSKGRNLVGQRCAHAVLTAEDVRRARVLFRSGTPLGDISRQLGGVNRGTIRSAINRSTWKWVE